MEYPEQYVRWLALKRTLVMPPADAGAEYTLAWFDEALLEWNRTEGAEVACAAAR